MSVGTRCWTNKINGTYGKIVCRKIMPGKTLVLRKILDERFTLSYLIKHPASTEFY